MTHSPSFAALRDTVIDNQVFQAACRRHARSNGSSEAIAMAVLSAAGFPNLYIDALRYRWLRVRTLESIEPRGPVAIMSPEIEILSGDLLDQVVDAAMDAEAELP
ncbi:hypothetical protein [Agrobacterium vitis]|uniref:hypothetical protein n=1 Tax=Agrobacterium vitis TaxID=373 RepID=UPI0015772073|nr:hypothetical protein G6L01_020940 [Agrobacterium vitis]